MSSLGSFRVPAGRRTGGMPGEFPSSVTRSVKLSFSALDQTGSNEMSGVGRKADALSAEDEVAVPRSTRTVWVERGLAAETTIICVPHIVIWVGRPRKSLTEKGRGNPDLAGCRQQNGRMGPKARGGPEARPATRRRWSTNQQRLESSGVCGRVEPKDWRPHPIRRAFSGPGRRDPAVSMATTKESTRCRRINTL